MRTTLPLLALALVACNSMVSPDAQTTTPSQTAVQSPSGKPSQGTSQSAVPVASTVTSQSAQPVLPPGPQLNAPKPADAAALAKANNGFAFDLYGKMKDKQQGNFAYSPASIDAAVTMLWDGAKGDTEAQIRKMLHATTDSDKALETFGQVTSAYANRSDKVTLRFANRLFGEKTYKFEQPFLDRSDKLFGAPLQGMDFKGQPDQSRVQINDWVAKQTNDRIKNLIPELKDDTRLVIANAVYFKADWSNPFEKQHTFDADFHVSKKDAHKVATMHGRQSLPYGHIGDVSVIEKVYGNGDLAMDFVLPDDVDGLGTIESHLDQKTFDGWMTGLKQTEVDVSLPKVKIDTKDPVSLKDVFIALGMTKAFDVKDADLTGIGKPADPKDKLFVSAAFHKAFVLIDEEGTEAAAATAILVARAGGEAPSKATEFKADHPYMFFLRDTKTGMILFAGHVTDPGAK